MSELYPAAVDMRSLPPFKAFYLAPWFFAFRLGWLFCRLVLARILASQVPGTIPERMTRALLPRA